VVGVVVCFFCSLCMLPEAAWALLLSAASFLILLRRFSNRRSVPCYIGRDAAMFVTIQVLFQMSCPLGLFYLRGIHYAAQPVLGTYGRLGLAAYHRPYIESGYI